MAAVPYLEVRVVQGGEPVGVQVQGVQVLQVGEGVGHDLADGVARQRQVDQAAHVGEVAVPQRGDEVVHQPQLGRLPVDVGGDEQEARLGSEDGAGRQQVLACAGLMTQHGV